MKKWFGLFLVFGLVLSGCSGGGEKKEDTESKTLVVYSPNSEGIINAVIPAFEQETGIKVELISSGTGDLFKRLESESSSPYADVMFGGSYALYLNNPHLFQEYVSKNDKEVIKDYRNTSGYISPFTLDGSVLIVNKNLAKDIKIESYEDLLNPALKGKIASADAATSSSAFAQLTNMLLVKGGYEDDAAWDFVGKLIDQLDGKIQSGSSAVYKSVADGEMVVGLSYEDPSVKLMTDGAPVDVVYPKEGVVYLPAGMGIVKDAKNKENAKKFVDFVLSKEIQDAFGTQTTNRPVRMDAEVSDHMTPFDKINVVVEDMEFIKANREAIIKRYTDLFISRQK